MASPNSSSSRSSRHRRIKLRRRLSFRANPPSKRRLPSRLVSLSARVSSVNQQFVGENTQAIDCRGFYSKDDWTERDRLTAVPTRERYLCGSEVTLRPNEHQYASRTSAVLVRIGFQSS